MKKLFPKPVRRVLKRLLRSPAVQAASHPEAYLTQPKLSVIIPSYNVEEYLEQCVESVLAQTYRNLEIIIVDDGATDTTPQLSDALAARDSRITVLHQPNGGLSNARNNGFKASTSDFVAFLDSDDWLPPKAYESMMKSLMASGADVATGNVTRVQGTRQWQSWNQSFTHVGIAKQTTLAQTPELLFDATAWNKVYRRSLLEQHDIQFPEGKLYEDMHPVARAYIAARAIDIVPENVYYYRIRDDNSSITQKRGELKNLADKLEMIRRIADDLEAEAFPSEVSQVLVFKALEGDIPVYSPFLGESPEFDAEYMTALKRYWNEATHETLSKLSLDRRVLFSHQVNGDIEFAAEAEAWVRNNFHQIEIRELDGTIVADRAADPAVFARLPADADLDMCRYAEPNFVVTSAKFDRSILSIEGFAYIDYLPSDMALNLQLELVADDGSTISLPHESAVDVRADGYWKSGNASRASSGFAVAADARTLFPADPAAQNWTLWAHLSAGALSFSSPIEVFWRGGESRLGTSVELARGKVAYLTWRPWHDSLRVCVFDTPGLVTGLRQSAAGALHLELTSSMPITAFDLVRGRERVVGAVEDSAPGRYVAHFSPSALKRARNLSLDGGWCVEATSPIGKRRVALSPELAGGRDYPEGWQLRTGADGTARVLDQSFMLVADTLEMHSGAARVSGTCHYRWPEELLIRARSSSGAVQECELHVTEDMRFEVLVPYTSPEDGTAWKPGEYKFEIFSAKWGKTISSLRATVELTASFPLEALDEFAAVTWNAVTDTLEPSIRIAAPRTALEKGRFNRERIAARWQQEGQRGITPLDAALYSVDVGSGSGDSARAILHELQSRGTAWSHYWAVEDRSVPTPPGTIPVVRDTELWYEIVNRAKLIVNNYGGLLGFNDWAHQYYVQTWHGTPLKTLGRTLALQGDPRWVVTRNARAKSEAAEWDLFVSQNTFMSAVARDEFFYEGEICEAGYPRNDNLSKTSTREVEEVRAKLGLLPDAQVLLYAPTWRDDGSGSFSQKMFDGLDSEALARQLGESWTILLRGHSFNKRAGGRDRSNGRIIDVTDYPELNDLLTVADVLVTDYSSIMFDYLVTRKPIVYFAPDLEHYVLTRGMYFDYQDVLAGPLTQNIDELVHELSQLSRFSERHGQAYARQVSRFVPWDDGQAAGRVVDRIERALPEIGAADSLGYAAQVEKSGV